MPLLPEISKSISKKKKGKHTQNLERSDDIINLEMPAFGFREREESTRKEVRVCKSERIGRRDDNEVGGIEMDGTSNEMFSAMTFLKDQNSEATNNMITDASSKL